MTSSLASSPSSKESAPPNRPFRSPSIRGGSTSHAAPSTQGRTSSTSSRGSTRPTGSSARRRTRRRDHPERREGRRGDDVRSVAVRPDVVADVAGDLAVRRRRSLVDGIRSERLFVDPGLGFGKTPSRTSPSSAASRSSPPREHLSSSGRRARRFSVRSRAALRADRLPSRSSRAPSRLGHFAVATRSSSGSTTSRRRSASRGSGRVAPCPRSRENKERESGVAKPPGAGYFRILSETIVSARVSLPSSKAQACPSRGSARGGRGRRCGSRAACRRFRRRAARRRCRGLSPSPCS